MNNVERALLVAEKAHAHQTYDIYPYIYHIKMTVKEAKDLGYDEVIQVASALHDVLEDTDLNYNDVKKAFGLEVAEIVFNVTDGRNRKERKAKTYVKVKSCWKSTVVKICDRIANMKHSKSYNPEKQKMYQKEFENFVRELSNDKHPAEVDRAWSRLKKLSTVVDS